MKFSLTLSLFFGLTAVALAGIAQEEPIANRPADPGIKEMDAKLDQAIAEFRDALRDVHTTRLKYLSAETYAEAYPYSDEYYQKVDEGNAIREEIISVAIELFERKVASPDKAPQELDQLVSNIMATLYRRGEYSRAYHLAKQLVNNNPENIFAEIYLARTGLINNDFSPRIQDLIKKHEDLFAENGEVTDTEKLLALNVELLHQLYQNELKIREAEAADDDLPRVKFTTTKGDFVIELFENEAPQTVANFISLVEAGHYDGLIFHTVIDQTAAETGMFSETGTVRHPGYHIYDEFAEPDARLNFSGSVSLNSENPNSGAARFFVSLAPLPNFNHKQTVFGRILTGMDTINRIEHTYKIEDQAQTKIDDAKPDKIISAVVIRKRDHDYQPTKVPQK